MIGRRVQSLGDIELPGDYYGPTDVYTGGKQAVFFLKPNARDDGAPPHARGVHHVTSPPHVFRECPDGSLEIRESIGDKSTNSATGDSSPSDGWHGYLNQGHEWVQV